MYMFYSQNVVVDKHTDCCERSEENLQAISAQSRQLHYNLSWSAHYSLIFFKAYKI